ncbi:MAG: hypothetical protein ACOYJV_00130 [Aminivibrio sp.]
MKLKAGAVLRIEAGDEKFCVEITKDEVFFPREEGGIFRLDSDTRAVLVDDTEMSVLSALGKEFFGIDHKAGGETAERLRIRRGNIEEFFNEDGFPMRGRWLAIIPVCIFEQVFAGEIRSERLPPWK